MLHHVELYVRDVERSRAFWTPFMGLLGYVEERWSQGVNYLLGEQGPYVCLVQAPPERQGAGYHRRRVGLNHLALRATSRARVETTMAYVGIRALFEGAGFRHVADTSSVVSGFPRVLMQLELR